MPAWLLNDYRDYLMSSEYRFQDRLQAEFDEAAAMGPGECGSGWVCAAFLFGGVGLASGGVAAVGSAGAGFAVDAGGTLLGEAGAAGTAAKGAWDWLTNRGGAGTASTAVSETSSAAARVVDPIVAAREQIRAALDAVLAKGPVDLTFAQRLAIEKYPSLEAAFRGYRLHQEVAKVVAGQFRYSYRGPDFTELATGIQIELTTIGQEAVHQLTYPWLGQDQFLTYTLR